MDVAERLSLETVTSYTLIACEHVQRYEFAANACLGARVIDLACGVGYGTRLLARTAASVVGVDIDATTIDTAEQASGDLDAVSYVAADAAQYLRTIEPADADVIVCFEGLEHVRDLEVLIDELSRLAAGGVKLVYSVPNGKIWEEDNPFHQTDFSLEDAKALLDRLGGGALLIQQFLEGAFILDPSGDGAMVPEPQMRWPERAEYEYAGHYIGLVGITLRELSGGAQTLQLAYAPTYNRHIRNIERANAELWRTNARLAWSAHTHSGSGAAAAVRREQRLREEHERTVTNLQSRIAELEEQVKALERRGHP